MELGGRDRELTRLAGLYEGGARVALVIGGEGAGKAGLVGGLLRRRPAGALCGRCVAGALPWEPFAQMGLPSPPLLADDAWETRRAALFAHVAGWLDERQPPLIIIERVDLADA